MPQDERTDGRRGRPLTSVTAAALVAMGLAGACRSGDPAPGAAASAEPTSAAPSSAAPTSTTPSSAGPASATADGDRASATASASPDAGQIVAGLGTPTQIAVGDLDGDGQPEIVAVDRASLRITDVTGRERARVAVPGGIQVLEIASLGGAPAILTGWGRTRDHREGRARISVFRFDGERLAEEIVAEPTTTRDDVVAVIPAAAGLVVAYFESKYVVHLARADKRAEGWKLTPIDSIRMATSLAIGDVDGDGEDDLVVGRIYGDEVGADGDAFVRRPDGARIPIPIVGGVRSLTVADIDGDGDTEILIGDGWNRDYGKVARARLTLARWRDGAFTTELLEESPGQYTLWDLVVADLDGDGAREIVTRGDAEVRILRRDPGWSGRTVAKRCHDVAALPLAGATAVLASCERGVVLLAP